MKSILIVEDEEISALVLKKIMSKHFKIKLTDNSADCLTICSENVFDFVILDINLGAESLDGLELLNFLKSKPTCKNTKFIAITAYAMPGDKEKYIEMGFDLYFSKPILFDDVIKTLLSFGKNNSVGVNS